MKKFKINLLFAVALILANIGCTKSSIDKGGIDRVIKYNPDIQNITFNYCVTCHGGLAPSGGLSLTNHQNVRSTAEGGTLLQRISDNENPMPPSGLLSEEQIQVFEKWIEDGFPEN